MWTFNAANTYASPYQFASSTSIGSFNDLSTTAITISGGTGTLTLAGGDSVSGNTADLLYVANGANLTFAQNIALGASGNFEVVGTGAISTPISGGFVLTKTGAGTLTLSANSTYTGATIVNAGTLTLTGGGNGGGALSGTSTITVNSGATLVLTNGDTLGYTAGKEALVINRGGQVLNNSTTGKRDTLQNTVTMTGGILGGNSTGDTNGVYSFDSGSANGVTATSDASGTAALINASKISLQTGATFNISRGTATPAADLIVTSLLIGYGGGGNGITKTGNGILVLTGAKRLHRRNHGKRRDARRNYN